MLNRRILRVKVMQALYAYKQCKDANAEAAFDLISEKFSPDLNTVEEQNYKKLEGNKRMAGLILQEKFAGSVPVSEDASEEIVTAVEDAWNAYLKETQKDAENTRKFLINDLVGIYDKYLLMLNFLSELSEISVIQTGKFRSRNKTQEDFSPPERTNLPRNRFIKIINTNEELKNELNRKKLSWEKEQSIIKMFYNKVLREDEYYSSYSALDRPGVEADYEIMVHIVKLIFRNELMTRYFEEKDFDRSGESAVIKGMLLKTIKNTLEDEFQRLSLVALSPDWPGDREFVEILYDKTVEEEEEYKELISARSKNWDVARIAAMDKVILMMALCEMIHCPSIPIKVTINEYIELSKTYSTPKSRQFVNGLLDKIAQDLTEKGVIKKTGRGLLDNK